MTNADGLPHPPHSPCRYIRTFKAPQFHNSDRIVHSDTRYSFTTIRLRRSNDPRDDDAPGKDARASPSGGDSFISVTMPAHANESFHSLF
jgi:hypothetical protein